MGIRDWENLVGDSDPNQILFAQRLAPEENSPVPSKESWSVILP